MLRKKYNLRGLNLRDSDINRGDDYASDVLNVELNKRKELVKRFGLTESAVDSMIDLFEYKKGNELIGLTNNLSDAFYKYSPSLGVFESINYSGFRSFFYSGPIDSDEYNGVLYFADSAIGSNPLYKYDGYTYYRAGVPAPEVTTSTGAGGFFYRIYIEYRDARGNITSGDYVQFDNLANGASFTVQQMGGGFYERWATTSGAVTANSGTTTINVNSGHNYIANDYIILPDNNNNNNIFPIRVDSVTATTVVLDSSSMPLGFSSAISSGSHIDYRTAIRVFKSSNATFGYEDEILSTNPFALNLSSSAATITSASGTTNIALEDVYDTTLLKGLPPRCKYITFYNNIMILANKQVDGASQQTNRETDYESSYYWSDTGVGSTVETFPPFNTDVVGKSREGEITGVEALDDNVVIAKERQIYYANGNPILQTFRTRSALTNGIGCISFKSMQEIEGGVLFMSQRGLYLARYGAKPIELSDVIEPLFKDSSYDLDLTTTRTVNDILNEKLYIHIQSRSGDDITLVYDYLWKEWFLHKYNAGENGVVYLEDTLYLMGASSLYERDTSYNDDGVAIEAYYKSAWFHEGFPSMVKKWVKFIVLSIGNISWTCNVKNQHDWNDVDVTDENIAIDSNKRVDDKSLNMKQTKAMRIEIGNNVIDEGMLVTGYEYEFEYTQERPKGDD